MKSKLMKVIGVLATIGILASALVAAPAMALTQPTVSFPTTADAVISTANADYTIVFTTAQEVPIGSTIDVTFPSGYTLAAITGTFAAGPGWISGAYDSSPAATAAYTFNNTTKVLTATIATENVGEGAQVRMAITAGITNPTTAGSYTVTVGTATGAVVIEAAVTSSAFTLTNPTVTPPAGVASVYNSAGVLMSQSNSLATALGLVPDGGTIKLTAGLYPAAAPCTNSVTIQGTGTASDVTIQAAAAWTLSGAIVVIDGLTIDANTTANFLTITSGTSSTVKNSVFKGALTGNANLALGGALDTVDNCTFTVVTGAVGIAAGGTAPTIKNSTFSIAGTGKGILSAVAVTVTGNTFTGTSAGCTAIDLTTAGISSIKTNTFKTLDTVVSVTDGTSTAGANFVGNTVDACGVTAGADVFIITTTGGFAANNNVITNSKDYVAGVAADDAKVSFVFNDLSGSVKGFNNTAAAVDLLCSNNYWGSVDPAATGINSAKVDYTNKLSAAPGTSGKVATAVATITDATAGVTVNTYGTGTTTASNAGQIGFAVLAANPTAVAVVSTYAVAGYYDVIVAAPTTATDDAYIKFTGTTAKPITATSDVLIYNVAFGRWDATTLIARNTYSNYIEVMVETADLAGTPVVLVTATPAVVAGGVGAAVPASGATAVPVKTALLWPAVAGATSYDVQVSGSSSFVAPLIADETGLTTTTFDVSSVETLDYSTQYWWRVRAVNAVGPGAWATFFFTTLEAPAPTTTAASTAPVVTITTAPTSISVVTVPVDGGSDTPAIPSYLLWIVIAVGAILVIVVIVLIVRTRRV